MGQKEKLERLLLSYRDNGTAEGWASITLRFCKGVTILSLPLSLQVRLELSTEMEAMYRLKEQKGIKKLNQTFMPKVLW